MFCSSISKPCFQGNSIYSLTLAQGQQLVSCQDYGVTIVSLNLVVSPDSLELVPLTVYVLQAENGIQGSEAQVSSTSCLHSSVSVCIPFIVLKDVREN